MVLKTMNACKHCNKNLKPGTAAFIIAHFFQLLSLNGVAVN